MATQQAGPSPIPGSITITLPPGPVRTNIVFLPSSSQPPPPVYTTSPPSDHGLSTGQIVGIVFGSVFGAAALILIFGLLFLHIRKSSSDNDTERAANFEITIGESDDEESGGDSGNDNSGGGGSGACTHCGPVTIVQPSQPNMWPPPGGLIGYPGSPFLPHGGDGGGSVDVRVNSGNGSDCSCCSSDVDRGYISDSSSYSSFEEEQFMPPPPARFAQHGPGPEPMFDEEYGNPGRLGRAPVIANSAQEVFSPTPFPAAPPGSMEPFGDKSGLEFPRFPPRIVPSELPSLFGGSGTHSVRDMKGPIISFITSIDTIGSPIGDGNMFPIDTIPFCPPSPCSTISSGFVPSPVPSPPPPDVLLDFEPESAEEWTNYPPLRSFPPRGPRSPRPGAIFPPGMPPGRSIIEEEEELEYPVRIPVDTDEIPVRPATPMPGHSFAPIASSIPVGMPGMMPGAVSGVVSSGMSDAVSGATPNSTPNPISGRTPSRAIQNSIAHGGFGQSGTMPGLSFTGQGQSSPFSGLPIPGGFNPGSSIPPRFLSLPPAAMRALPRLPFPERYGVGGWNMTGNSRRQRERRSVHWEDGPAEETQPYRAASHQSVKGRRQIEFPPSASRCSSSKQHSNESGDSDGINGSD